MKIIKSFLQEYTAIKDKIILWKIQRKLVKARREELIMFKKVLRLWQ